jgi:peptide/nickel transport system permease protein
VSVLIFSLIHIIPGDPITTMLGPNATSELVREMRSFYGLDRPLPEQYAAWLSHLLQGDLGRSILTRQPVTQMILERLPATLLLAVIATLLGTAFALPVGIIAAVRMNSPVDYLFRTFALLGVAIPNFVLAVVMILVFAVWLRWVPISGAPSLLKNPASAIPYFILPTIVLGVSYAALMARVLRSGMLEVLSQDYIRTARAKGLSSRAVLWRHALTNALLPLITIFALNFAYLFGGAAVMEQIFGLPGMGSLIIQAALQRDYPLIQGISLFVAVIFVASSLTADFLYALADPRVRAR